MIKSPTTRGRGIAVKRMREALEKQVEICERRVSDKELYEGKDSDDYKAELARKVETEALVRVFNGILDKQEQAIRETG